MAALRNAVSRYLILALCLSVAGPPSFAAAGEEISGKNWGLVVAPVYGTSHPGYPGAELFAGPGQFDGDYYHGVLPNGRIVRPAGTSVQIGMNPLGARVTPDGRYLVTSNDDERGSGFLSQGGNGSNVGGYSLSVIDTNAMKVVSRIGTAGRYFVGLQISRNSDGSYRVWASGGGDNNVKLFRLDHNGSISVDSPAAIAIPPLTPAGSGFVSNYAPSAGFDTPGRDGLKPPVPSGFNRAAGARITFPAGLALSPDARFLYVACNGDNSLAIIDTSTLTVVKHLPVGFFPYDVAVSRDGTLVYVSNWGITTYKFAKPSYDAAGKLVALGMAGVNEPEGYYVPKTSSTGANPQTSSVSIIAVPGGNGAKATVVRSIYLGKPLDTLYQVGDTHPCALALVGNNRSVAYVARANSDSLGLVAFHHPRNRKSNHLGKARQKEFDLSPVKVKGVIPVVHGAYPNAIVAAPDHGRVYVAEAGTNSVAVLDTHDPWNPKLLGRIPTGWYPTALALSPDGKTLFVINAKGVGEDATTDAAPPSRAPLALPAGGSAAIDSNYIFGSVQKVDLARVEIANALVAKNNFVIAKSADDRVVPVGGGKGSGKIRHVFFILHENKTFDSMLGDRTSHFGPYAATTFNDPAGGVFTDPQFTGVALNTRMLATAFATAVNYYSDAEESDAGHQFAASGTATDYTEKSLLVKNGRGLLVNKNIEPEDYPEAGYIFNNAARHGVSFKDYGALIRIAGTDTGTALPTGLNDPGSGKAGFPAAVSPLVNVGDVDSPLHGLGQSYFMSLPVLAILGGANPSGEPRLDHDYPGYNFNISDQRRALEFIRDFDRMVAGGTLPRFIYIYQPNDHTGATQATNAQLPQGSGGPAAQVADGDIALGMVVEHIMASPVYYDRKSGEGSAIFVTWDDAQSTLDHIHPHRTPLLVISPYARPGFLGKRHYSTASIVKTEELLLGLPPGNLGDLFATDLRDMFQPEYNGITTGSLRFTRVLAGRNSPEGERIWALAGALDTSAPDRDSRRLGRLARLSMAADRLHDEASAKNESGSGDYRKRQERLYELAVMLVSSGGEDGDD